MIWIWIGQAIRYVGWLLFPPFHPLRVNVHERCPACGHEQGKLEFIRMDMNSAKATGAIQHTCAVCGLMWAEKAISAPAHPLK